MARLEALYVWYAWTIAALLCLAGADVPDRWWWVAGHVGVVLPAWLLTRAPAAVRIVAACVLVPTAFTTLGIVIPDLSPEPFHWRIERWDRAIGGRAVKAMGEQPPGWLLEVCQACYSTFYFLPLGLGLALVTRKRWAELAHTTELVAGGFLLSYLGYVLMPTLPPYRFLAYPSPLEGSAVFHWLNEVLYEFEACRQDCMPSGHAMITLLVVWLAWRYAPMQLVWLGPTSFFIILATIVLRYHWFVDLVVALPFTVFAIWLFRPPGSAAWSVPATSSS